VERQILEVSMKLLAAVLLISALNSQSAVAADEKFSSSLLGAWAVDISRLPMAPETRPKSVTITFTEEGKDRLRTRVEVIDPAGGKLEADGVTPLDGTPTAVKSNFEADLSATFMPRPEVLVMQLAKNGRPASTRIYAVGADGKSMIETVAYFDSAGRPVLRKNYFTKLR
jgi:hypothetical protein